MVATPRALDLSDLQLSPESLPDQFARVSGARGGYEEYHPFGSTAWHAHDSTITARKKRYRYTGKEKDEETGLSYHGARYYAPWLGRWCSADPAGMVDGPNRYAYVRNGPVGGRDPTGLAEMPADDNLGPEPWRLGQELPILRGLIDPRTPEPVIATSAGIGRESVVQGWELERDRQQVRELIGNTAGGPISSTMAAVNASLGGTQEEIVRAAQAGAVLDNLVDAPKVSSLAVGDGAPTLPSPDIRIKPGGALPRSTPPASRTLPVEAFVRDTARGHTLDPVGERPGLPDSYWVERKAPTQITPGARTVNIDKPSSAGGTYHSTTHYDEFGRQIGQTHRTSHGRPTDHPDPHHHRRDATTGAKLRDPNTGSRVWPGWFGWNN